MSLEYKYIKRGTVNYLQGDENNNNLPFKEFFETIWLFCCIIDRLATTFLAGGELLMSCTRCCVPFVMVGTTLVVGVVAVSGVAVWDCDIGAILFSVNI